MKFSKNGTIDRQYRRLVERDGPYCHYCQRFMTAVSGKGKTAMSREHIVPQSFGGTSKMDNMVLACRKCNNRRGTQLNFCKCDFCTEATNKYWWDFRFLLLCIEGKPKVYKRYEKWFVEIGNRLHVHKTFEEAHSTLWLRN